MKWFDDIRERVNLSLYNSRETVLPIFSWLNIIVATGMIGILIYYYGFPQTPDSEHLLIRIIEFSFIYYTFHFFVKILYNLNPLDYIKNHKIETIVVLFLVVEGISYNFYGGFVINYFFESLGFHAARDFSNIIIQLFFIVYVFTELFKKRNFKINFKVYPGLLFMLTIAALILIGTGLLLLPEMRLPGKELSFLDAMFLSVSSASVTGLDSVGMLNVLSVKGQIVVLFLLQIGALNAIAFGALYLMLAKFGIGLKQHKVLEDYVNESNFLETEKMFYRIVKWVLIIEIIGAILVFMLMEPKGILQNTPSRLFHAVFHTVSSFCNAGISMMPNELLNPLIVDNYALHIVTFGLFFLGAFGMVYLFDLFGIKHIRDRMRYPWKTLRFDTKLTLYTTLGLMLLSTLVFFLLEYNNSLEGKSWFGQIVTTGFNSMASRTTGLLTVPVESLSVPFLLFFLFLMFIGGSSASSSGGIRVSTFAIILGSVVSTIRRRPQVEMLNRTIDNELVLRAYSILIFFIVGNIIGVFALSITEQEALAAGSISIFDLIFEHVSASCTVGTSTGITQNLTSGGKIIIMIAMFIGRCGTLTIAYLFGRKVAVSKYKYPKGHTMVG